MSTLDPPPQGDSPQDSCRKDCKRRRRLRSVRKRSQHADGVGAASVLVGVLAVVIWVLTSTSEGTSDSLDWLLSENRFDVAEDSEGDPAATGERFEERRPLRVDADSTLSLSQLPSYPPDASFPARADVRE
jgi:hypothetical protein